jgi:hypothetical protein
MQQIGPLNRVCPRHIAQDSPTRDHQRKATSARQFPFFGTPPLYSFRLPDISQLANQSTLERLNRTTSTHNANHPHHHLNPPLHSSDAHLLSSEARLSPTMPLIRRLSPSAATEFLVPRKCTRPFPRTATASQLQKRSLSSTAVQRAGHAPHYDQPGGWLWGVPPGQKPKRESWETMWYWGYLGAFGVTVVAYAFKPDTRYALLDSIESLIPKKKEEEEKLTEL